MSDLEILRSSLGTRKRMIGVKETLTCTALISFKSGMFALSVEFDREILRLLGSNAGTARTTVKS